MARYIGPVGKISRRLGIGITEKGQRILAKRPFPPGQHGPSARRRQVSDYGLQLLEKQKARYIYGVLERQFRRIFEKAQRFPGETGAYLLILLERRLDNVVYRLGFATTRAQARQLVTHGHITVNGRKTNIPSYTVRVGETIAVRPESRRRMYFKNLVESGALAKHKAPDWLRLNPADLSGEVVAMPRREDAEPGINEQLIVEFYSR
ncbi:MULTISPECIES: 30S ribosomal protein S4 [Roseiflexus]|jgi:small subunit ribosomal protein S4|uniref:Small ribosomal subunit protein uS4 n=1 Tax=Roseiflexus castenholzii (strain DSM 13941 / HLO8) TaxID=383372 RepID=RS4_ROSCS|nr:MULTISPECIES: 30S ribosomal protein S4 [Roseiflexus]A7NR37.1 RecName: Full=Small ribosomal subunit protein uS4; AltName: Full=30S ribosomal protein S4 [Roseiflexus castenholzii DSM 13941]ABU60033.1 ribosomal protein S4 [Roseiflexus castenholzii DSM 13941]GIW02796.1 MAG: 30S ribosomal protein S4 [Roseiflexus sp.]